jgi:hypothetical protein
MKLSQYLEIERNYRAEYVQAFNSWGNMQQKAHQIILVCGFLLAALGAITTSTNIEMITGVVLLLCMTSVFLFFALFEAILVLMAVTVKMPPTVWDFESELNDIKQFKENDKEYARRVTYLLKRQSMEWNNASVAIMATTIKKSKNVSIANTMLLLSMFLLFVSVLTLLSSKV